MEIKNIERAKELIPQLEDLQTAKRILSEDTATVYVQDDNHFSLKLPKNLRMNIIHVVNCEYERMRRELEIL